MILILCIKVNSNCTMTLSNVKVTTQVNNKIYDMEETSRADLVRTTKNSSDQSI